MFFLLEIRNEKWFLKLCHFLIRERERDPCIDAQQDDEQGLDGVDDQHEEQGIV